jgi:hypothetical protein
VMIFWLNEAIPIPVAYFCCPRIGVGGREHCAGRKRCKSIGGPSGSSAEALPSDA